MGEIFYRSLFRQKLAEAANYIFKMYIYTMYKDESTKGRLFFPISFYFLFIP